MTDKTEAQRLADVLDSAPLVTNGTMRSAAALLRTQSERIAALEAALEQARVALEHWQMDYGVQNEGADLPRHAEETRAALRKIKETQHG